MSTTPKYIIIEVSRPSGTLVEFDDFSMSDVEIGHE